MARLERPYQAWEICDANGARLAELTTAAGRTLAYKRNSFAEASFSISHEDDAAALLLDAYATGVPTLKVWRFVPPYIEPAALIFNGYLAPFSETVEETAILSPVFRSPFAQLLGDGSNRGRFTAPSVSYVTQDAGQIAKDMIDDRNADSYTGLATTGTIDATVSRDRTYQFANVGQAIINLTNVINGFDFQETFVDGGTTLAEFSVHTTLDEARPAARFEYGTETMNNVRSMSRTTQPPINVSIVLGANGAYGFAFDATSISTYGRWYVQYSASDVTEQSTLDDKSEALLRPAPVQTISFVPEYALESCPQPSFGIEGQGDFWIGSACPVFARRGAFNVDTSARINAARVVVDENGFEASEIPDPLLPDEEATIRASLTVEVLG